MTVKEDDFVVNKVQIGKNSFFFSGGSVKLQHYCFSSSCCAGHAGSAYQSITTWMIVAGCAAGLGIYLLSVGLSYCLFTGLEPMSTGTLGLSGTRKVCARQECEGTPSLTRVVSKFAR